VVTDRKLAHIRHLYNYRNETDFVKDLDEMLKLFEPVSMNDFMKEEAGGRMRMVITFDDGLAECYQVVAPLLKKKGIPALFLLNNNFIDNKGLFFRYKAGILIDRILSDPAAMQGVAEYLVIPEQQVVHALHMINYRQQALLDAIAAIVEMDFSKYLAEEPVYMSSEQVEDLVRWGFEIGGHSNDHADFALMDRDEMIGQVRSCLEDLARRFKGCTRFFSFPFTSRGVPAEVIDAILDGGDAEVLLGTAGLKKTGRKDFIQRIPMEALDLPARDALKAEFFYYLLKKPLGKNVLHY
jgi:peptidoglycan/xylan/chitin deacetylase (PgdA/CDA1 family)